MSISGRGKSSLALGFALGLLILVPARARGDWPPEVASYRLRAELDPASHQVLGQGTLTWHNRTAHPATELRFHLYLNGFRNSASSFLGVGGEEEAEKLADASGPRRGWGWVELRSLRDAAGRDLLATLAYVSPDDGNPEDRSVARVALPEPVPPGGVLQLDLEFVSQLPRVVERTGYARDFHLVAQWFPKLGVFEEDGSWTCPQFHYESEFYSDYGTYDVTLVVPKGYRVGATGVRLSAAEEPQDRMAYRHRQEGVHDFTWTAWPGFVEVRRGFEHPDLPPVEVILLLRRETAGKAERYFRALFEGLRLFGLWYGPYPYPTLTMVDPPWSATEAGGMEYPTFITTGSRVLSPPATLSPETVTVHEFGHQYWYGLLASDEFRESFLDEGVNTYSTARVLREVYPPRAWSFRVFELPMVFPGVRQETPLDTAARYFRHATVDPIARTAWGYLTSPAYGALTYSKMALLMEQVERTVGSPAMERAMRSYAGAYRFRHPRTADLVRTLSVETGRDLTPLFRQTLTGSEVLDYAVVTATSERRRGPVGLVGEGAARRLVEEGEELPGYESEIVVRRLGGVRAPVATEITFRDGRKRRLDWDGEERWVRYRVTGPELAAAEVDPDEVLLLDGDRLNNSRRAEPDRRASRRWGQRLRFWIQNALETFASFA